MSDFGVDPTAMFVVTAVAGALTIFACSKMPKGDGFKAQGEQ
jgi:hypothetical protein